MSTDEEKTASDRRVQLALEGKIAQRALSADEARRFDAVIAECIEHAVKDADFT